VASLSIALNNDRRELARLAELVDRFGAEHHVPEDTITSVNLVLDEIVSNVIKYGGARDGEDGITVSLVLEAGRLTIDVSDGGIAFNPLEAKPPNLDLPITERPIGGLGIHIVKAISETIAYRRENDRNHLTMTMLVRS
jgi:anti-sigma regulatory factor (Ser/Thr protein kinase)